MKKNIMDCFPDLTKKHKRQINSFFTAYIFYKNIKDKKECWCTACNKHYIFEIPRAYSYKEISFINGKHNDEAVCPYCHTKAIFKSVNIGKKNLTEHKKLVVLIARKNALYLRCFYATKCYNGDPYNKFLNHLYTKADEKLLPDVELSETTRYYLAPGQAHMWKYYYYGGWTKQYNVNEPFNKNGLSGPEANTYWFVNDEELEKSFLKYANVTEWYEIVSSYRNYYPDAKPVKYLCEFARYPCIEYMLKTGFEEFVIEKILWRKPNKRFINWEAKTPKDIFKKITKQELNELKKCGGSPELLRKYIQLKKAFQHIKIKDVHLLLKEFSYYYSDVINNCCKYNISPIRIYNYITKQTTLSNRLTDTIISWCDYIKQAQQLKYDLSSEVVILPKDLEEAHQTATDIINQIKREVEEKSMAQLTAKYIKKYSFENDKYMIVVPKSMQDIINEGKAQHHCVGGYADRHAKGLVVILFLRKKSNPDKPFYTMEISPTTNKIVQCRGFANNLIKRGGKPKPKDVIDFEKDFEAYLASNHKDKAKKKTKKGAA